MGMLCDLNGDGGSEELDEEEGSGLSDTLSWWPKISVLFSIME